VRIPEDASLSAAEALRIRAAATKLLHDALPLVGFDALHAIGALLLAAGTSAAYGRLDYDQLIALVSAYYEGALLQEVERELRESEPGTLVLKRPDGVQ
jgi:hypothetical protein